MNKILQLCIDNAKRAPQSINFARNAAGQSLYLYGVIGDGWDISALQVISALSQADPAQDLHIYMNSPGGDVFEGRAIMAELARFGGKKIGHIDSLCASAMTSIAMACDEVEMSDGAFFMIHNASGIAFGDKNDMRETADLLEKVEGAIVNDYTTKTGKGAAEVVDWMNAETWFSAAEALDNGFVDRIAPAAATAAKASNAWNLAAYAKAPQALANAVAPKAATAAPQADPDDALSADEVQFLTDMAAMHEAAIARSKAVLPLATSDDVEDLAESIITTQAGQLELMKTWIDMGAAPEPDEADEPAAPANSMTQSNRNRLALLTAL